MYIWHNPAKCYHWLTLNSNIVGKPNVIIQLGFDMLYIYKNIFIQDEYYIYINWLINKPVSNHSLAKNK